MLSAEGLDGGFNLLELPGECSFDSLVGFFHFLGGFGENLLGVAAVSPPGETLFDGVGLGHQSPQLPE